MGFAYVLKVYTGYSSLRFTRGTQARAGLPQMSSSGSVWLEYTHKGMQGFIWIESVIRADESGGLHNAYRNLLKNLNPQTQTLNLNPLTRSRKALNSKWIRV